ncbi:kinase-like protein [Piedraia hortae CBS 480.64]|uniref:Kinase-like protein n=1 Tax=Piedraia hortae CBS 480.64 TaxID=1314780 RepID=A0A6A7BTW6_9PEZI|nr:kinase-like protein [Piedraia hortae CBS 480.64]
MNCMRDGFLPGRLLGGRFLTVAPLNHGSFGMVFTATDLTTEQDVAIKCMPKSSGAPLDQCPVLAVDDRSEELKIHSRLRPHRHIVNLIHHFETEHHQYMALELCGNGDLYEAIRIGRGPLETEHVRDFMLQLVDAVEYLHANGVFHRDIKPENIFLTSRGDMKLGDFGLATTDSWSTEYAVGSDRYMAPEQFAPLPGSYGYSTAAADIWAIGIVLLNILFQRNPFARPNHDDPLFADYARDRQSLFDVFPTMSQDTYNVLVHSLSLDPSQRSLSALRDALKAVISFTTDDETLDDFCTAEQTDGVMATVAREPLRTPSIVSPSVGQDFHWEQAGAFPSSWEVASNRDSGFGASYNISSGTTAASNYGLGLSYDSESVSNSLPISINRPMPLSWTGGLSKSWSDLYEEDHPITPRPTSEDGHGSITPRPDRYGREATASPLRRLVESERREPPRMRGAALLDKWAALGQFRRTGQELSPTRRRSSAVRWEMDNNWREHKPNHSKPKTFMDAELDDYGELKWMGIA